jgi:hypothetical protein
LEKQLVIICIVRGGRAGPAAPPPTTRSLAAHRAARTARIPILVCAAALLLLGAPGAFAQLALTTAGVNAGYQLTTFATGFPNYNTNGPLGMAFSNSGGILVSDYLGNVRRFPTTADGQNASSVNPSANFGVASGEDIVRANGNLYMARRQQADLVQLNENGTLNQVIVTGLKGAPALYVCGNPANGHLFVAGGTCHKIWDVDPVAKTATVWRDTLTTPQQMTLSEDGQMLFVAMATNPGDVLGIDVVTKATVFDYAALNTTSPLNKPAGVAIGSGDLERDLFVCCGDGTVWQIDRGDATATLIASGGSHGRAARCSINQSLLLAQTDRIMRLTAPAASGFGYNSPYNLTAVATAGDRIALYWEGVPGAIGYNIYRAFNAGEEDYNAPPQNLSTPWTGVSYAGGNNYRYVDTGLFNGLPYFYTVKAVFPEGLSVPSVEDSDSPDASAIPWDSGDPNVVTTAIRQAYSEGQILIADSYRCAVPDGRIYEQTLAYGPTTVSPPDGSWLRYTERFRRSDGTYVTLPDEPTPDANVQSLGALQQASDGPYRRVMIKSDIGYAGCKGNFYLPDANNSNVGVDTDGLYLYLGSSSGAQHCEVDAGLERQPGHTGWTPFCHGKQGSDNHYKRERRRELQGAVDFQGGQTVLVTYLARPAKPVPPPTKSVPPMLTISNQSGTQVATWSCDVFQMSAGIRLKRIYSIAQGGTKNYHPHTGSWYQGAELSGAYAIAYGGRNDRWDVGMTVGSLTGSYPASGSLINWVEYSLYDHDTNISIDLR